MISHYKIDLKVEGAREREREREKKKPLNEWPID